MFKSDELYRDTDSVMFCLSQDMINFGTSISNQKQFPRQPYLATLMRHIKPTNIMTVCEYLSNSKQIDAHHDISLRYMRDLIPKIVNRILSYTCVFHT